MVLFLRRCKKRRVHAGWWLWAGLIFLWLSACGTGTEPQATPDVAANVKPVQVLVWDDAKQIPLLRASVTLTIPNNVFPVKETDNSGRVVFDVREDLLTLTATFVIQKEGYQPQRHTVTLDSAPVITIYLVPNDATAVPRATASLTPTSQPPSPSPENTQSPTPIETPTATATTTTVPPTLTPSVTPSATASSANPTLIRRQGVATVFVLGGPDVVNTQLGTLDVAEVAEIIGRTEQNEWLQIVTERNVTGWVANCEVTLSTPDLSSVPVTWGGIVRTKDCLSGSNNPGSGTDADGGGACVIVTISRTDWPNQDFDDILLSWSNVPASAAQLKLWVTGPTRDGGSDYVIDPTFSDTTIAYNVELFKFTDGDFMPGATYTYTVQPLNAVGETICTTQGTFVP